MNRATEQERQSPRLSLPVRLVLLVAGTMLPLIVFAVGIVFHYYMQDRREARQRVVDTVRSVRLTLDAEMQRMTGGLQVLALTDALKAGDFERFRPIALGFLDQYGKDGTVLVADRDGHLVFSSNSTDTASLPLRNNREIVDRVFRTRQPQYSDLFIGVLKNRLIVTVEAPVFRNGEVTYEICFSPPMTMFQTMLEKQRPSADWTLSVLDRKGIVFARVPNPEDTISKRASPSIYDEMMRPRPGPPNTPTIATRAMSARSALSSSRRRRLISSISAIAASIGWSAIHSSSSPKITA